MRRIGILSALKIVLLTTPPKNVANRFLSLKLLAWALMLIPYWDTYCPPVPFVPAPSCPNLVLAAT